VSQEGSKGRIVYTTKDYSGKTKIKATCTGEDGKKEEIELKATSPGVFEGETEAADTGIYSINVTNTEDDVIKDSKNTRLAMQYSQEYRFEDITDCLDSFTSQSSGKFIDNLDGIFDSMPEKVQANKNITVPLLAASVIFLLIDIVYRRLDLKLGAKLAIAVQGKAAAIYQAAREETVKTAKTAKTSSKTARSQAQSTENNNAGLKEDTQDMLDIGSLLAKQKERER